MTAEAEVRYRKLARAYAAQQGAPAVIAPKPHFPGGGQLIRLDRDVGSDQDEETALRPTREELDEMPLSACPVDEQVDQVFRVQGLESLLMEAACGFRPYAVALLGEKTEIEAWASSNAIVADVTWQPGLSN